MIWSFRFKDGIRGVQTKHVEADSLVKATERAEAWVRLKPGAVFIPNSVEAWLITADVEQPAAAPVDEAVTPKPTPKEQRERLKQVAAERMAGTGVGSAVKAGTERVGA